MLQACSCNAARFSRTCTWHVCDVIRCPSLTKDAVVRPLTLGACRELPAGLAVDTEQTMDNAQDSLVHVLQCYEADSTMHS